MADRTGLVHHDGLSNLVFKYMLNASVEQKRLLNEKERKMFLSETAMHQFCMKASIDTLLQIYVKLGGQLVMFFYQDQNDIDDAIISTYGQYELPDKRTDSIEALARHGVAAITSQNIMLHCCMVEQNARGKVYQMTSFGKIVPKKSLQFGGLKSNSDNINKSMKGFDDFAILASKTLGSMQHMMEKFGLDSSQMRVLLYLFLKRDSVAEINQIAGGCDMPGNRSIVIKSMRHLIDKKYAHKDTDIPLDEIYKPGISFMITGKGQAVAMKYLEYIHLEAYGGKM